MPAKKQGSTPPAAAARPVDIQPALLDILVCPVTGTPLVYDKQNQRLISEAAHLAYPIKQGVPVLVPAEATRLKSKK